LAEYGIENSIAKTNFYATVNADECTGCETCLDRCNFNAITVEDVSHVDIKKCTGCGLCVITCPSEALSLARRPEDEKIEPPRNMIEWRQVRAQDRGIDMKDVI
jgi:heterodisulfide reductase subunit A-like polyferredoxin